MRLPDLMKSKTTWKDLMKKVGLYKRPHDYFKKEKVRYWPSRVVSVWYDKSNPDWILWQAALADWKQTLVACRLTVVEIDRKEDCAIEAGLYLDYSGGEGEGKKGWTDLRFVHPTNERQLLHARITLSQEMRDDSTEDKLSMLKHEWGHALGLQHSPNDDDIMHPSVPVTYISSTERNTLVMNYEVRQAEKGF